MKCTAGFQARVNFAARCIRTGETGHRDFDNCFENFDGDLVVTALWRMAEADRRFMACILRMYSNPAHCTWSATAARYATIPDHLLSARASKMREIAQRESSEAIAGQTHLFA